MFIVCFNGLSGFPEAIRVAFPETKVQLYIEHLVRAALKYVTDSDSREVATDLKTIYQSATVLEAEETLNTFGGEVGREVPDDRQAAVREVGRHHRAVRVPGADPQGDRHDQRDRESVNSVIRKFTRKQYPNGESALKLVYLAIHESSKKWTMPIVGWKAALNHFAIVFEGRLPTRPEN